MDVELTEQESEAVQNALRSYLSDLRMEIADTDNSGYKRTLREERAALEAAVAKMEVSADVAGRARGDSSRLASAETSEEGRR